MSRTPIQNLKVQCQLVFVILLMPLGLFANETGNLHISKKEGPEKALGLSQALAKVRANDLSLLRFDVDTQAFHAEANASHYLPDPVLFAAAQSIPTDTFDLDQEPMTQLRFGVRQMFPKGDTLSIKRDLSGINAEIQGIKKASLWRKLKLNTETAWLEAWYWQKNKQLIEEDRVFLTQVLDFVQSLYQVGVKDQSNLIGAELELIKLDEKQIVADRNFRKYRNQLNTLANENLAGDQLSTKLLTFKKPGINFKNSDLLMSKFLAHPEIKALDGRVDLLGKKVNLAEQAFEPTWGMEVSYGLRGGENNDGSDRADFLNAGVSVQLPLFTKGKQSQTLSAAKFRKSSIENMRLEALQKMRFQFENVYQQYLITVDQRALYEQGILPTLARQKQSALQSYESDKGDFRTVTDLFSKEQNAKIRHQRLRVNEQLMIAKINYWIGLDAGLEKESMPEAVANKQGAKAQ